MNTSIVEPEVRLIDYTGMHSKDPLWAAKKLIFTKRTRLDQNAETHAITFGLSPEAVAAELSYIRDSVRSSWEFVSFTFVISGITRGFTHQLVRTRTASYAQQSQRVLNVSNFDYGMGPAIAADEAQRDCYHEIMSGINEGYKKLIAMGAPVQDARGVLPTAVETSIIVEMNLRTLADLAGKRDNPRAEGEYFKAFAGMRDRAIWVMPWIEDFLYPPRTQTEALDAILTELRGNRSPVEMDRLNTAMKELDRLKAAWG